MKKPTLFKDTSEYLRRNILKKAWHFSKSNLGFWLVYWLSDL